MAQTGEEAKAALSSAEMSKKKIMDLILSSSLDKGNIAVFNSRLSETTAEIDNLNARLDYLKSQSNTDFCVYDGTADVIREMKRIKNAINFTNADNPDLIRQALIVNIEKIVGLTNKEYMFYFNYGLGSSNGGGNGVDEGT